MKILENTRTVFSEQLVNLVKRHLEERVRSGEIAWADTYDLKLDEIVPKLANGLSLDLQDRTQRIDREKILQDLEIAKIFLTILRLESRNIDRILGTHELLRKDNVRAITDIKRRYLDIVNHSVQEFKTRDVEIRDGKIRLFPAISQSFKVREITTEYFPESQVKRIGNNPTPENISAGTDKGFWESIVYTRGPEPAKAIITMDFGDTISFNRLKLNSAGRFPLTISNVEVLNSSGDFASIHVENVTSKFINIVYPQAYETSKVRLTVEQTLGQFVWWTDVDNERDLIQDETQEAALRVSTRESIQANEFIPIVEERLENVYAYTLAAYNIILYLDIYPGNRDGIFYSRKFTADSPIETIQLSDEILEYKPSDSSISYSIIQQDGSRVSITPTQKVTLDKTFSKTQTLTNGSKNWVQLSSSPLDTGILVFVNGESATQVDQLTGTGVLEYIISGKKLFFSVPVEGKTVTVRYNHKTDFFIIEVRLNNNVQENSFDTPSVENFGVIINGID